MNVNNMVRAKILNLLISWGTTEKMCLTFDYFDSLIIKVIILIAFNRSVVFSGKIHYLPCPNYVAFLCKYFASSYEFIWNNFDFL